jgi:Amylo-alpha-1,6-glucosidase
VASNECNWRVRLRNGERQSDSALPRPPGGRTETACRTLSAGRQARRPALAIEEHGYQGQYKGGPRERDGAYHQGTTWGWLLGPFVLAHLRVHGDRQAATSFLEPLGKQISSHGLGTLSEIFDGDAPFTPRGCIAQAWTVGEVLRAWRATLA